MIKIKWQISTLTYLCQDNHLNEYKLLLNYPEIKAELIWYRKIKTIQSQNTIKKL